MNSTSEGSGQRISQLDGWRGVSISFVVLGHLVTRRYSAHPDVVSPSIADVLSGWGVDIFFVISGFIITKLALREHDRTGRFSIRNFYVRRFFRIVPPFFFYLLTVLVFTSLSMIRQTDPQTLAAAAFICNLPPVDCGWFAGHSWSLAYEEQFYLSFPLFFGLAAHRTRKYLGLLFIVLVVFPLLRFFLHIDYGLHALARLMPSFSYLCAGAVVASYETNFRRLAESRYAVFISAIAAACLAALLSFETVPAPIRSTVFYLQVALENMLLPVCVAWIVGSSVFQSNYLTRFLTAPPVLFLGMISYSLYLWQEMFTAGRDMYLSRSALLFSPLMFVVATLSYYLIERPCVTLGKRFLAASSDGIGVAPGTPT